MIQSNDEDGPGFVGENDSDLSDEELQEAFAAGLLKPGLNVPTVPQTFKNNVEGLKQKLQQFKFKADWIERLDIYCQPAVMAPEMFHEISEKEKESVVKLRNFSSPFAKKSSSALALDDFKREMMFHRQAQSALLEGIARLTSMGIPTQRPDDYFAEMAKTDEHMHKVRESLAARKAGVQRSERMSDLRKQKKLNKQTQVENKMKQAKEKKKMLNEVQKFRKGARKDLDFLDGKDRSGPSGGGGGKQSKGGVARRKIKNERFGFGGKKRGSKRNTSESSAGFMAKKGNKSSGKFKGKAQQKRPGKSKRMKGKGRR